MHRTNRREGFILLSVLISTVLLITSATAFAWFARNEAMRAESRENILKCRNAAEIATVVIGEKIASDANGFDSFAEELYRPGHLTRVEIGDYEISATITPLNDRISTNGIFLPDGVTVRSEYEYAWQSIWTEIGEPQLASTVIDFMDKGSTQRLGGSERAENINRVISDLSELKAIPEINDEILWGTQDNPGGLSTYLSVYGDEVININTASPRVLAVLDDAITSAIARQIDRYRSARPFTSLEDLTDMPGFPSDAATRLANIIGFESTCFLLNMTVLDNTKKSTRNYKIILERCTSGCRVLTFDE